MRKALVDLKAEKDVTRRTLLQQGIEQYLGVLEGLNQVEIQLEQATATTELRKKQKGKEATK